MTQENLRQLDTEAFVKTISRSGIKLRVEDDQLKVRAPKGAMTKPIQLEMKARKQELLNFLLQQNTSAQSIEAAPPLPHYPLSFAQQRLWFLDQFEPKNPAYNMPFALRLAGTLSVAAMEQSLHRIVERHRILAARFHTIENLPAQMVDDVLPKPLAIVDLTNLNSSEALSHAKGLAQQDANRGFDLQTGPVIRYQLIKLQAEDFVLLLNMHHIVSDGWSMGIFIQEMAALYAASLANQTTPLPPLPIQYFDFAHWQQSEGKALLSQQQQFWKTALHRVPTQINLPVDHPRPKVASYHGAAEPVSLSEDTYDALKRLAQREGTTSFMLLLSLYGLLLTKWCQQQDFIIGTTVANRNRRELEPLIGFFVNTLPLRFKFSDSLTFRELLRQVKTHATDAFANGDMPFEQLIDLLKVPRDPSRPPLVQAGFTLNVAEQSNRAELPGLKIVPLEDVTGDRVKTELTLLIREHESGASGMLAFNVDLFAQETMASMATQFQNLAQTVAKQADQTCVNLLQEARVSPPTTQEREDREFGKLCRASNLSENQLLIWLGQTLDRNDLSYHNTAIWHLYGPIGRDRFKAAFNQTLAGSEALRSVIVDDHGVPQRKVQQAYAFEPSFYDLRTLGEAGLQPLIEAQAGLDLQRQVFRCALCQLAHDHFVWLFTVHQIVGDGIAVQSVFETTAKHYAGHTDVEPEGNFNRFIADSRTYFESPRRAKDQAYFLERCQGFPGRLDYYGNAFAAKLGRIHIVHRTIEKQQIAKLLNALDHGSTRDAALYSIFLTNLVIFLWRTTSERNITVGVPIHNRRSKATKKTIGSFMHVVPIAVTLDPQERARDLYRRLGKLLFEAMRHGRAALKNQAQQPLYDVMLNYQTVAFPPFDIVPAKTVWHHQGQGKNGLVIQLNDFGDSGELRVDFECHEAAFEADMRPVIADQFFILLNDLMQHADETVSSLNVIERAEREAAKEMYIRRLLMVDSSASVIQLIEHHAEQCADTVAVIDNGERVTYGELDRRAQRLATTLIQYGVGAETPVGILMDKSMDLIVAITAVLKAGATYLPLNPSYPQQRLQQMVANARPALILANAQQAHLVTNIRVLDPRTAEACEPEPTPGMLCDENTAYIIFTSGSTGQPKGVQISYGALANAFYGWQQDYELDASCTHLQMANFSFDVFSGDFVRALCAGGTLVLTQTDDLLNPQKLYDLMREHSVTHAEFVPAVLRPLLAYLEESSNDLSFMKMVMAGSDKWSMAEYRQLQRLAGADVRIINSYGVTEACIDSTWFEATAEEMSREGAIPIGDPFPNVRLHIMSTIDELAPIGVPGELFISGEGLARGYLDDPAKTAERFQPNPHGPWGTRRYHTGDLARILPSGDVLFLGRSDDQVKLRGYRIELGEIETRLAAMEGVQSAVVVLRDDQLIGYVTGTNETSDLRSQLKQQLPDHMVPSVIVALINMPLTPNGKIDRRALPAPDPQATQVAYVGPRNETEETLVAIWRDVLSRERIGINDHFFDLGGHSLKATQVVSRISRALDCDLQLRALFEHPTIAALSVHLASESARTQITIPFADRSQPLPLSFAQQRLWFLDKLEGPTALYNMPFAFMVEAAINRHIFAHCITELVKRHENLRTTFHEVDGEPQQRIHAPAVFEPNVIDLAHLRQDAQSVELKRLAEVDAATPFNLSEGPLLRATLINLGENRSAVLINIHHIVCDGWSTTVFLREWETLYRSFSAGQSPPLPELPIQYADFAAWQRTWLSGERLDQQIAWWRSTLADAPPLLELPTDRPRPAVQQTRGGLVRFEVDARTTQALRDLAKQQEATLSMVLMGSFATLLQRYSRADDIVIGSPSANRNLKEIEPLIGFFANTLAFRIPVNPAQPFEALIRQVRQVSLDAYAHQDTPFELLVDALKVPRSLSHSPIFQVMFVMQNMMLEEDDADKGIIRKLETEHRTAKFDILLAVSEHRDSLSCAWEYQADLFDHETAERMTQHFAHLLKAATSQSHLPVEALPLTDTPQEAPQPPALHSPDLDLAQLFERQVLEEPYGAAVLHHDQVLTYAELNQRANQIAHGLMADGIKPGDLVGICCERTPDLPAAVLAVLKVGAAYVPLDPNYPRERLALMLGVSKAKVILTQRNLSNALPVGEVTRFFLDEAPFAQQPDHNPALNIPAEHLAYVIFTSGSTGVPKGVAMTRAVLQNLIAWQQDHTQPGEATRTLQYTSLSFDVHFQEIFATFRAGGCLCMISEEVRRDPFALLEIIETQEITSLFLPFVALNQLAQAAMETKPNASSLRRIVTAGEALLATVSLRQWLSSMPQCRLINQYGPSETHVVTAFDLAPDPANWHELPPIGTPVSNAPVFILDTRQQAVPAGVPGELYLADPALARGYLNRPELTAIRFVPHPFEDGARLYRTGDLVCLRKGQIHFLGRVDHQVKLRGYRIELGEIESVLNTQDSVSEAAVIVREDTPGRRFLAAYVCVKSVETWDESKVRTQLSQRLPEYMLPTTFTLLKVLPLTPSGKLNRRALPVPDLQSEVGEAPQTHAEQQLAAIWQEVLGLTKVYRKDHFFELGGHSLLATKVLSRIRNNFGKDLPLKALFAKPRLSELAQHIEAFTDGATLPAITSRNSTEPTPLSFNQQRMWFLHQLEKESAAYNLPAALRLDGELDVDALTEAFATLIQRHDMLRTTFPDDDGTPFQLIHPKLEVPLKQTNLMDIENSQQAMQEIIEAEANAPFDLKSGPLMRLNLIKLAAQQHVLCINMHHIISDGWSVSVLISEIAALYHAFHSGQPSPLSTLPIQYADFAAWQQSHAESLFRQQRDYWRDVLHDAPDCTQLPLDFPRRDDGAVKSRGIHFTVNAKTSSALKRLGQQQGTTLYMCLLASFATLISRYGNQSDLVIGSPVSGRSHKELEPLIGFFLNTLALRIKLSECRSFSDLLAHTKDQVLDGFAHQNYPFEQLVQDISPQRNLTYTPIFQVLFVLQNTPQQQAQSLPELKVTPLEGQALSAKYDLTLAMEETEEGLRGAFKYNALLFEEKTIGGMTEHLHSLLRSIVTNPQNDWRAFHLLSPKRQNKLLALGHGEFLNTPLMVHEAFAEWAQQKPQTQAVRYEQQWLSYSDLDTQAQSIAAQLQRFNLPPESRVAIGLPRSTQMIAAIFGVLRAGYAYVPLDPQLPQARLQYMCDDAQVQAIITNDSEMVQQLSIDHVLDTFQIDQCGEPVTPKIHRDQLAYVVYTSGSTGKPKGVGISHRAIANYAAAICARLSCQPGQNHGMVSTIAADLGLTALYAALSSGGCLHLIAQHRLTDAQAFAEDQVQYPLDFLKITPSHMAALLTAQDPQRSLPKHTLILGGEATPAALTAQIRELNPKLNLLNHYGPTESTIGMLTFHLDATDPAPVGALPLEKPLANTRAYVLNEALHLVPKGGIGELFIGGVGLARGYLGKAAQTAALFLPDPFSQTPGARIYRSGDLVKRGEVIQFMGRADHQVKIRGFRVELGELEKALRAISDVREAAVIAQTDPRGGNELIAYIVAAPNLDASRLRRDLQRTLPLYLLPAHIIPLERLPITANGKLDRMALPQPKQVVSEVQTAAPETPTEHKLVDIWSQVLNVENPSIDDDFFQLGGHSLLAVRLVSHIRETFSRDLPLAHLFRTPTIRSLATYLDEAQNQDFSTLVPLNAAEAKKLFIVHPGGGNVLSYQPLAQALAPDMQLIGIQSPGLDPQQQTPETIEAMATRYVADIDKEYANEASYAVCGWSFGGLVAYEMARIFQQKGLHVKLALLDTYAPGLSEAKPKTEKDLLAEHLTYILAEQNLPELLPANYDQLSVEDALQQVFQRAKVMGLIAADTSMEVLLAQWHVFRANHRAAMMYKPAPYKGDILFVRPTDRAEGHPKHDYWQSLAKKMATLETPGNHSTMVDQQHAVVLAILLKKWLS